MKEKVHPTAVIEPGAVVADDARVGAYAYVGSRVVLGPGCILEPHAIVRGRSEVGPGCHIHSFAVVGGDPQMRTASPGRLEVGEGTVIREHATVNVGSLSHEGVTRIGPHCLLMAYTHVAHDCQLGPRVVLSNCAQLAGHVSIDADAVVSGYAAVHQYCHIGRGAFLAGAAKVDRDVPPFVRVAGDRAAVVDLNVVGLRRLGYSKDQIGDLKHAYKAIFRSPMTVKDAIDTLLEGGPECEFLLGTHLDLVVKKSPDRLREIILALPFTQYWNPVTPIKNYFLDNPSRALELAESLTGQRKRLAMIGVGNAMAEQNFQGALKWATEQEDPALRSALMKAVVTAEGDRHPEFALNFLATAPANNPATQF